MAQKITCSSTMLKTIFDKVITHDIDMNGNIFCSQENPEYYTRFAATFTTANEKN